MLAIAAWIYLVLFCYASCNQQNTSCPQREWDETAKKWDDIEKLVMNAKYFQCEINQIKSAMSSIINSHTAAEKSILDCGCGAGRWSRFAVYSGAKHVVALDLSPNFIKLAKNITSTQQLQKIEYGVHDMNETLPLKYQNRFDVVINIHLVCHAQTIEMLHNFYANMRDAFNRTKGGGKIFTLLENHNMNPFYYSKHLKYGWIKHIAPSDEYYYYKHGILRNGTKINLHGFFPREYTITTWSYTIEIHEKILSELGYRNIKWIQFTCNDKNIDNINLHKVYADDMVREFVMDYYRYPTNIAVVADIY